jgi:hypothetical protein
MQNNLIMKLTAADVADFVSLNNAVPLRVEANEEENIVEVVGVTQATKDQLAALAALVAGNEVLLKAKQVGQQQENQEMQVPAETKTFATDEGAGKGLLDLIDALRRTAPLVSAAAPVAGILTKIETKAKSVEICQEYVANDANFDPNAFFGGDAAKGAVAKRVLDKLGKDTVREMLNHPDAPVNASLWEKFCHFISALLRYIPVVKNYAPEITTVEAKEIVEAVRQNGFVEGAENARTSFGKLVEAQRVNPPIPGHQQG